jgi:hypothetical protein
LGGGLLPSNWTDPVQFGSNYTPPPTELVQFSLEGVTTPQTGNWFGVWPSAPPPDRTSSVWQELPPPNRTGQGHPFFWTRSIYKHVSVVRIGSWERLQPIITRSRLSLYAVSNRRLFVGKPVACRSSTFSRWVKHIIYYGIFEIPNVVRIIYPQNCISATHLI